MSLHRTVVTASPAVLAAWRGHLPTLTADDPDAMTCAELAALTGYSRPRMGEILKQGVASGAYTMSKATRPMPDGSRRMVPVYKLVAKRTQKRK